MSIYFDFKTIKELIGEEQCRKYGMTEILDNAPIAGVLSDNYNLNDFSMSMNRQTKQDTSKFTPDDWIRYTNPLVNYALRENNQTMGGMQGTNMQRLYQKIILMGVLVGLGKTPQEAINQVQDWQNSGASQLLKGSTGATTGGGTGTTTGGGTGTTTGGGTGTTTGGTGGFGIGTGGFGSGSGMGAGGFGTGTGGFGSGSGMGTGGSTGTNTRNGNSIVNKRNRLYYE